MPDISVLICAYTEKRWHELSAAIESAKNQTLSAEEIIVVVDHNPDLMERMASHFSGVTLLENRVTKGLAGARNTGIAAARGDIIAFLDDDAVAQPDWLQMLSTRYSDKGVAGVGGRSNPCGRMADPVGFPKNLTGWWVVLIEACLKKQVQSGI